MVLLIGILYSLPNLYPAKPSIQATYANSALAADQNLYDRIENVLDSAEIDDFNIALIDNNIAVNFNSLDDQLKGKSLLERAFLDEVIIALNLQPSTPEWLKNIGGSPLRLGLDLSGGVHFLLEVDIENAVANRLESALNEFRKKFREDRVRYVKSVNTGSAIIFNFDSNDDYGNAINIINKDNLAPSGIIYDLALDPINNEIGISFSREAIKDIRDYAVGQNLMTLRNRVNELGVSEPIVQRQGSDRIVVQLPGVQDTTAAKKIIGKTANLEFRMEATPTTSRLRKETFEFKASEFTTAELERTVVVSGDSVTNASTGFDENGFPQVNITLDMQGGRSLQKATTGNIGRRLGVLFVEQKTRSEIVKNDSGEEIIEQTQYVEKKIISLATVQAVLGTSFRITGVGNTQEASELALLLRAGALAAPMKFVEERTVGPSLGIRSIIIGLVAVVLFMLFYYRWFGFAANLALISNLILITGFMSLIGATLTLPGIAGIVLTVGMAVDANVLIFSRIREELGTGTSPQEAIKEGFSKAFTTIFDANITTLIAAIVLYAIGTGPVKGFAITLSIGILTSMFTAILGTRAVVNLMYGQRNLKELKV